MKKKKRITIRDFIKLHENEKLTLENFSEADTVLFATLGLIDTAKTMPLEGSNKSLTLHEIINKQIELHGESKLGALLPMNLTKMIMECASSNRYKDIKIHDLHLTISLKLRTQSTFFIADLDECTRIIAFGSTDDTVVGWEEDLDLIRSHDVECLKQAKQFVIDHFEEDKKYIFIGHSKGGMESAYSFLTVPKNIQDRVLIAYDLDGPGFNKEFVEEHKNDECLNRLKLICPTGSFVGRMFYQPVKSIVCLSTAVGIMQHNPDSWVLKGMHFKRAKSFSSWASIKAAAVNNFIFGLDTHDANKVISGISKIASAGNTRTLSMLVRHPFRIFTGVKNLSKAEKKALRKVPFQIIKEIHDEIV